MNIEPTTIYTVVGTLVLCITVLGGAITKLYLRQTKEHDKCEERLGILTAQNAAQQHTIDSLMDHNIAQQWDIDTLNQDRQTRGLVPITMKSHQTRFYKQNVPVQ